MRKSLAIVALIMLATGARAFDATPLMSFFQPVTASSVFPISDLVGHWLMNDNAANTTVADTTGNKHGTAQQNTSALSKVGKINNSLTNNGSSDYVSVPDFYCTNITVALWVNFKTKRDCDIIAKDNVSSREWAFEYYGTTLNMLYIYSWNFNGTLANAEIIPMTATVGTWYHLAWTYNGTTNRVYLNGVYGSYSSATPFTGNLRDTTVPITMGKRSYATSPQWFDGQLDDVRIYNRTLTDTEISAIYNAGSGTEQE